MTETRYGKIDYDAIAIAAFDSVASQFNSNPGPANWRILEACMVFRQHPNQETLTKFLASQIDA